MFNRRTFLVGAAVTAASAIVRAEDGFVFDAPADTGFVFDRPSPMVSDELAAKPVEPGGAYKRRVLLLSTKWCHGCKLFDRTEKPKLLAGGWRFGAGPKDHIQHIGDADREAFDALCDQYGVTKIPAVVILELGRPIAVLQWTEARPKLPTAEDIVAAYNAAAKAVAREPVRQIQPQRGGYPSTFVGTEYTVDPPTRRRIIWHLYAEHGGFGWQWLNSLTWPQLLACHSDLHNGRLQVQLVGRS